MTTSPPPAARPWARVRDVLPIPNPMTVQALLDLPEAAFAELVRGNLLPRSESKSERAAWSSLWWTVSSDPQLLERGYGVLSAFLDATEAALADGVLDAAAAGRARKFRGQCLEAWARLTRDEGRAPLAWAGAGAAGLNPEARKCVALLVSAIAAHRSAIRRRSDPEDHDRRLWAALGRVGLDSREPGTVKRAIDVDEDALAWADGAAKALNPHGRSVAAVLVSAITAHRAATEPGNATDIDQRLWRILTVVHLDPNDYQPGR